MAEDRRSRLDAAGALAFEEDFFAAAELLRLVLDGDPDDPEALGIAAYLYLKQEAVNEAMACALRALSISTRTPTAVYALGVSFSKRAGLDRNAARVFAALARAVPKHPIPHVLYAESLLGLQKYGQAAEVVSQGHRARPHLRTRPLRAGCGPARPRVVMPRRHGRSGVPRITTRKRQGLFWELYDEYAEGRS